ncbi:MAG: MaoC family dehydratase [bacterium]|nr:MaoC family dehydratase [bacterium]
MWERKKFKVGDKASVRRIFTQEDVEHFSGLSMDRNPIHLNAEFAANSVFGQPIVHGMLVASLFSGLIGMELPGEGSIYLGQNLNFTAPVPVGEEVTASVEIVKIREDKPIVTLRTLCLSPGGQIVIEGEAVVKVT